MTDLSIAATRAELETALTVAGFTVTDGIPEYPRPPLIVMGCGDPYLEPDSFNGGLRMRSELFVGFEIADDDAFTAAADSMILAVLDAVPERWILRDVSPPFKATNLAGLISSRIRIDTTITTGD